MTTSGPQTSRRASRKCTALSRLVSLWLPGMWRNVLHSKKKGGGIELAHLCLHKPGDPTTVSLQRSRSRDRAR
jgi:hypothetical protein